MSRSTKHRPERRWAKVFGATLVVAIAIHLAQVLAASGSNDKITTLGFPLVFASWGGFGPPRCCAYTMDLMALVADSVAWFGVAIIAAFVVAVRSKTLRAD